MKTLGNIILSHDTSLAYWSHVGSPNASALSPVPFDPTTYGRATNNLAEALAAHGFGFGGKPLHILVPDKRLSVHSSGLHTHVAPTTIPPNSFYSLGDRLFVSSPELTATQLSRFMTIPQLAEAICTLIADYYIHPISSDLEVRRHAIASKESLVDFARQAVACRGIKKMLVALEFALPGARSPMEIKTALLLTLPKRYGGFGLLRPELNLREDPTDRSVATQEFYLIDIAYKDAHLGLEFFGTDYHTDTMRDRIRINELRSLGWNILTVDKHQVRNVEAFRVLANQIASILGTPLTLPPNWLDKHMRLRSDLGLP